MRLLVAVVAILLLGMVARLADLVLTINQGMNKIFSGFGIKTVSIAGPGFFAFIIGGIATTILLFVIVIVATSVKKGG